MNEFTLDKLPKKVLARIDFQTAFMISRCVVAAERLQLFRKLHGKELTAAAIGKRIGVTGWRIEAFLASLLSVGLLKKKGQCYRNSALADEYFVHERSIYWTRLYSGECRKEYWAFAVLEEMLTTGKSSSALLGKKNRNYVDEMRHNEQWAHDFTHMLYHHHQPHAKALAAHLDLSKYNRLLDVGGGSGVMSMALVRRFKHLKATVLDIETVVGVAKKIIRKERLTRRIDTMVGDMTKNIPDGYDVIMFCDAESGGLKTLRMVYDSLPKNGLVIITDDFSTDDLTTPLYRLMWQLRSNSFWLKRPKQIVELVREAGFKAVKSRNIYRDTSMITGRK